MPEDDRVSLRLARDPQIHSDLEAVGEAALRLIDQMVAWTVITKTDDDRQGQQLALAFYLGKIQRATRLALSGILAGQGREAMSLLREQYDYTLRFEYYKDEPREALLFTLTQAQLKVKMAKEVMAFRPAAASDPGRVAQLQQLEAEYADLRERFPDLMRPTAASAASNDPVMVPWSEPSTEALSKLLMKKWLDERARTRGDVVVTPELVKRLAASTYFMRAKFQSQSKHGTAFNIADGINRDRLGNLVPVEAQSNEPNELAWLLLQNIVPQIAGYKETVLALRGACFDDRLESFVNALEALGLALGIERDSEWD